MRCVRCITNGFVYITGNCCRMSRPKQATYGCSASTLTDRLLAKYCYRVHEEPDDAEFMLYDADGVEVIRYANTHFGTADSFLLIVLGRLHGDLRQPEWYCQIQGGSPGISIGQTDGSLSAMKGALEKLIPQNDWRVMFGGALLFYEQYRYEENRLVEVWVQLRNGLADDAPVSPEHHVIHYGDDGTPTAEIDRMYPEVELRPQVPALAADTAALS